jgi:bifunctional N-acetylglucosamine-1-phosphate-uridyltransferase/glucosamine-1-phosphate-acetyltransferase GlmU-like protein
MTSHPITHGCPGLRAVILAAGKDAITPDGRPLILQPLGDRSVLEHVIQNALQLVSIEHLYVVVGYRQEEVRERLGAGYHYVCQKESLGTAHAVLQAAPLLENLSGNLLILYGDTPLRVGCGRTAAKQRIVALVNERYTAARYVMVAVIALALVWWMLRVYVSECRERQ